MNSGADSSFARVAVVGAGISGLVCARTLADHGRRVRVFDKARGVGGRMSTRRVGERRFDHGAQYFTVRDSRFAQAVEAWRTTGLVEPWQGRIVVLEGGKAPTTAAGIERVVAVPGMNAICRHLAEGQDVALRRRVGRLERRDGLWHLSQEDGLELGSFDAVVVSAPAPQAAELLAEGGAPALARRAEAAEIAPCWATLVGFDASLHTGFDGAFVHGSPLSWIARNASKPGRPADEAWVLHASPEWTAAHLELDPDESARRLLESFRVAVGGLSQEPAYLDAHRWRYALPTEPLSESCLVDPQLGLLACGDWCGGPRVEGAYLSGLAAAHRLLELE